MKSLPDGTYDVIVVDAETTDDGHARIELTVTMGPHVGLVVALRGSDVPVPSDGPLRGVTALLGIPGTLRVRYGQPTFVPEQA
ncbi:MAG: hypothetical protein ACYDD4_04775 [Acidimicrobiales bacterium]